MRRLKITPVIWILVVTVAAAALSLGAFFVVFKGSYSSTPRSVGYLLLGIGALGVLFWLVTTPTRVDEISIQPGRALTDGQVRKLRRKRLARLRRGRFGKRWLRAPIFRRHGARIVSRDE